MKKIIINEGAKLNGEIKIGGSKNSVVALIPAALLCRDKVKIYNYPTISDVEVLIEILRELNVKVEKKEDYLEIDSSKITNTSLVNENISKLRASYYLMGALLALFNEADIALPGGCYLGPRPIDLHIKGLRQLSVDVSMDDGMLHLHTNQLEGNKIFLDIPSVGATINILLASIFAKGETIIENAAKEPEILDVANFLINMGAKIEGAGSGIIKIKGVRNLHGTSHYVIPDRIEAGTYLLFGAACAKEMIIKDINPNHLHAVISKLVESNVNINIEKDTIRVTKTENILPINIRTAVYPGFPTDLQQITTALMTQANGMSLINETIYSSRFKNCDELIRMGANIQIDNRHAMVFGATTLKGTEVEASDLRGGASLILAGLVAKNQTIINNVEHIFRGYSDIVGKLTNLEADIKVLE